MAGYFQYLAKAYELNNKHPLVLLHLAEHYFVIGEHEKSKEMCRRGFTAIDQMPKFVKVENNIRNDY
jgi:predicted Zn-dependent protease